MMWVKNAVSQGVADSNNKQLVIFNFDCDTVSDLPPQDYYSTSDNTMIAIGSTADVIDPKSSYKMKSDGTWVIQDVGNDYYSKEEIDDKIDDINDTDDEQDRALAELYGADANQQIEIDYAINTGSKNRLKTHRASGTSATGLTYTLNPDDTYTLGGTTTSNANISAICTLADLDESWIGKTVVLTGGISAAIRLSVYNGNTQTEYTDSGSGTEFEITQEMITNPYTIRLLVNSGTDCTGQVLKPMLRDKYIKSNTYEPYAPTNRELYEMILALQ